MLNGCGIMNKISKLIKELEHEHIKYNQGLSLDGYYNDGEEDFITWFKIEYDLYKSGEFDDDE